MDICVPVFNGAFDQLKISSISYLPGYDDVDGAIALTIYMPKNKVIVIPVEQVRADHINLEGMHAVKYDEVAEKQPNEQLKKDLETAWSYVKHEEKVRAVYMFRVKKNDFGQLIWSKVLCTTLIITDKQTQMIKQAVLGHYQTYTEWAEPAGTRPRYTLVHDIAPPGPKSWNGKLNGPRYLTIFAINADYYDKTKDFIIYRVKEHPDKFTLDGLQGKRADKSERKGSPFYYLEKTDKPNEVRLVHRRNEHSRDPDSQLFTRLPVGYIRYANPQTFEMYLLDTSIGCVYHLNEWRWDMLDYFEDGKDIITSRINIPFERFFNCPGMKVPEGFYDRHPADRCESVASEYDPREEYLAGRHNSRQGSNSSWQSILGICALLLLAVLFIAFLVRFFINRGGQKKKSTKMMSSKKKRASTKSSGSNSRNSHKSRVSSMPQRQSSSKAMAEGNAKTA